VRVGKAFKPFRPFKLRTLSVAYGLRDECLPKDGELLYNFTFLCGTKGWTYNPLYPSEITDNGDGSVHLKSTTVYGSITPEKTAFPNNRYIIEFKVRNVVGSGKSSIKA
jgi:hypothetical protein